MGLSYLGFKLKPLKFEVEHENDEGVVYASGWVIGGMDYTIYYDKNEEVYETDVQLQNDGPINLQYFETYEDAVKHCQKHYYDYVGQYVTVEGV